MDLLGLHRIPPLVIVTVKHLVSLEHLRECGR
jgi:hypothetical protein